MARTRRFRSCRSVSRKKICGKPQYHLIAVPIRRFRPGPEDSTADLRLQSVFHDGSATVTKTRIIVRSPGFTPDTGHYDVATPIADEGWTSPRRASATPGESPGGRASAATPQRAQRRAPTAARTRGSNPFSRTFYDDSDISFDSSEDESGDEPQQGGGITDESGLSGAEGGGGEDDTQPSDEDEAPLRDEEGERQPTDTEEDDESDLEAPRDDSAHLGLVIIGPRTGAGGDSEDDEDGDIDEPEWDGQALVGRKALKGFPSETSRIRAWHLGTVSTATPPAMRGEGWLFHVDYDDGDEEDLELDELLIDLLAPTVAVPSDLHSQGKWHLLKKVYEAISSLLAGTPGDFHGSNEGVVRTVFNMNSGTGVTPKYLRDKCNFDYSKAYK